MSNAACRITYSPEKLERGKAEYQRRRLNRQYREQIDSRVREERGIGKQCREHRTRGTKQLNVECSGHKIYAEGYYTGEQSGEKIEDEKLRRAEPVLHLRTEQKKSEHVKENMRVVGRRMHEHVGKRLPEHSGLRRFPWIHRKQIHKSTCETS